MIRRAIFSEYTIPAVALLNPVSVAGGDQELLAGVTTASLDGSGSYDLDGTITTYLWTEVTAFGAGITTPNAATTGLTGLSDGNEYIFRLTVTDNDTLQHSDDISIFVDTPSSSTLSMTYTIPSGFGTGTLDFAGGEPYERIYLSFELFNTELGDSADFSGANIGILDHTHPLRTGYVDLDSSGVVSKNYSSTWVGIFQCEVTITSRTSSEPIPAANSVLLEFAGFA